MGKCDDSCEPGRGVRTLPFLSGAGPAEAPEAVDPCLQSAWKEKPSLGWVRDISAPCGIFVDPMSGELSPWVFPESEDHEGLAFGGLSLRLPRCSRLESGPLPCDHRPSLPLSCEGSLGSPHVSSDSGVTELRSISFRGEPGGWRGRLRTSSLGAVNLGCYEHSPEETLGPARLLGSRRQLFGDLRTPPFCRLSPPRCGWCWLRTCPPNVGVWMNYLAFMRNQHEHGDSHVYR